MAPRTRRVTVRAYNLHTGDVPVTVGLPVLSAVVYRGGQDEWVDVMYSNGLDILHPDDLVTVTRTYA